MSFSARFCLPAKQNLVPVETELYELLGVSIDASEGGPEFTEYYLKCLISVKR
jgi:hypothetical protein